MPTAKRPPYWQMIKGAVYAVTPTRHSEIIERIHKAYVPANDDTIRSQIIVSTVNHPSRVHGPENKKPRIANDERYDLLWRVERGVVVRYDPSVHGQWAIVEQDGRLRVVQVGGG